MSEVSGNYVILFEDEFVIATDGDLIKGPQPVRIAEIDSKVVQVQGYRNIGPHQEEEATWEVEAGNVDGFVKKIQKKD